MIAQDSPSESTDKRTRDSSERKPQGDGVEAILDWYYLGDEDRYTPEAWQRHKAQAKAAIELLLLQRENKLLAKVLVWDIHKGKTGRIDRSKVVRRLAMIQDEIKALQSNQKGKA